VGNNLDKFPHWLSLKFWLNAVFITVSQENIQLRFDGPELRAHEMDVALLGPSLIALGDICTEANRILNREDAKVRVLIKADIKANCVTVDFSIVQDVLSRVHFLITNTDVVAAKTILEWIGILSGGAAATMRLVPYLRWRKTNGNMPIQVTQSANGNMTIVNITGSNNTVEIPTPVYNLSKSPKIIESIKLLAAPVSSANGIDEAVFIYQNKPQLRIDKSDAEELQDIAVDPEESEPQTFTAHIVIYGPILDTKSKHWKFKLNNRVEVLDIGKTRIAEDALVRGGVNVGDTYKVRIQMIERKTKQGGYKTEYKIVDVLEFTPGQRHGQSDILS
jgi:hypothetical protein